MQKSLPQAEKRGFIRANFVGIMIWLLRIVTVVIVVWGAYNSISSGTYSLSQWKDLVIFGLAQGGMYGLIALGYTLIYGILGFINFAHGDIFMSGMMVGYFVADDLNTLGFWNAHPVLSLLIILAVSMATSSLVAVIIERIAYKPLRNAPRLIPLITSIGASFSLEYLFKGLFGAAAKSYPDMTSIDGFLNIGGFHILKTQALVLGGVLVMMVSLFWFVEHTRAGKSIRAVAEDKEIAALMGVNVERTIIITFALGGAMAGAAGLFYALGFNQVYFHGRICTRHQGVYRRRAGRYWQHPRSDGGRCDIGAAGIAGPCAHPGRIGHPVTASTERCGGFCRADPGAYLPPHWPSW